jgi:DegV family protein with EDD domain
MSIRIVTDSSCDLPVEIVSAHGISVVPMYVNIGTDSYLDGVDMSRQQFYEGLSGFEVHPTTSVPSPGQFIHVYEQLVAEGATQILSIHISSSLSAVTNSARLAADEVGSVQVTVVDSGNLTLGTGLLALTAAEASADGRPLEDVVALLEDQVPRTYCFAALDTLEFLRRSGRLTRLQSRLGSLLQVKPVLTMNNGGFDMERVRTRKQALARVIGLVEALGPLERLTVVHTHAPEEAKRLREQAAPLFPEGDSPLFAEVTPVIGAHIGPGAVGFVAITQRAR